LLKYPEADLSLWRLIFYFQIWYGSFHPCEKCYLFDCLDWVPNEVRALMLALSGDLTRCFRLQAIKLFLRIVHVSMRKERLKSF